MIRGELRLMRFARPEVPSLMRHSLLSFLTALGVEEDAQIDIVTAVGEALSNAVEHAFVQGTVGELELHARAKGDDRLTVSVKDSGTFARPHGDPDRGFGLRIIRAVARSVQVDANAAGTTVSMLFDTIPGA